MPYLFRRGVCLQLFTYLGSYLCKLFRCKRQLGIAEEHVALLLKGYEVYVCVRYLHTQYRHADALAGEGLFQCHSHLLGKEVKACQLLILKIEDIVHLMFGYYEGMSLHHRVYVEEGKVLVILGHLVAGDFARHDSAEYACHGVMRC